MEIIDMKKFGDFPFEEYFDIGIEVFQIILFILFLVLISPIVLPVMAVGAIMRLFGYRPTGMFKGPAGFD